MDEELDRLSTSFAGILEQRTRQLQQRVDAFSGALERFSDRISNTINTIVAALPGSSSTAAPAAAGATSAGGIQLVRVMNETNQPVPVRVVESVARREESQGGGGFFRNLFGGIGSFVGNLVGGVASGFISPFSGIAVGAELVVAIGLLIPVVNRAAEIVADFRLLVGDIRTFANQLIAGIRGLIQGLFDNLTTAGILPVSRLLASLLIFIDAGIRLILTYVQPILNWVGQLLTALADWLGQLINRLSQWVQGVINTLPNFLAALLGFILETVVRPALRVFVDEAVRTALTSATRFFRDVFLTIVDILREVITHGITLLEIAITNIVNGLISALNVMISGLNRLISAILPSIASSLLSIPSIPLVPVPTAPGALGPRLSSIIESRFPAAPAAPPGSGGPVGPTTAPKLTLPGFRSPTLNTPEFRTPTESALEDILRPRSTTETAALTTAGAAGAAGVAGGAAAGITVNDGIHVQITAERVERDNADETARLIADRVLEEIQRRIELGRFRRGLSTGTLQ